MASESTRQKKHHRSSAGDDAESRSKRRKHRHHHHHRRHRSDKEIEEATVVSTRESEVEKIGIIDVEDRNLGNIGGENGGSLGEVLFSGGSGSRGMGDNDMEEGEIVDNYRDFHSDVESGEIGTNGNCRSTMGVGNVDAVVAHKRIRKLAEGGMGRRSGEIDQDVICNSNTNGYCLQISDNNVLHGDAEKTGQSPSIIREISAEDDRRVETCKDGVMDKERKYGSSRYMDRRERPHGRDSDAYGKENRDRGVREKEKKIEEMASNRKNNKLRDGDSEMMRERSKHRSKERDIDGHWERESRRGREKERDKERDLVKDRDREERFQVMRGTGGVADGKRGTPNGYDLISRHKKYAKHEVYKRDGDDEILHRRNSEARRKERSRRSDLEDSSPKNKQDEMGNNNIGREGSIQEDHEDEISEQLEEEDKLKKLKEESRRRTQAILEKYKNKQQQNEAPAPDLGVPVKHQVGESFTQMAYGEVIQEKHENQLEGEDVCAPESSVSDGIAAIQMPTRTGGLGEGTPKSERSEDIFSDDIFGESPAEVRKPGKGDDLAIAKIGLHDNWDDAEGYYGYRFGEILAGRYEIIAAQGKGVFSTVVRAKNLRAKSGDPNEVAIKIIRNNKTMYKAGMEELIILKKLVGADPEDRRHCVRFLSTFKYRNHLCLVFESLNMNLREVLKKFGRNIGLKLTAVRAYAKQLFVALKHLKNCGILHCDIKPDNILVNEAKNVLKLCDLGSAMFAGKNEITPYLVSRFYRAPEIILGLPYDHPLDVWSVGCCLFELYTGKVLFPGATNNDMLRLHMELKGPFPKKMLRKGAFTDQHFDHDLNFLATEDDSVSKKIIRRLIVNVKPKDFGSLISASPGEDLKMVAHFKDLMEKIFILDPDKRLNVSQALNHPFITDK
ncbi:serine/threonine-protein kinase prp4-like [Andrographis paniculata]|uniref:serine/threonine-protein kinase prp4-like n=1 Tax=Andrographis paniculata TaxID=175694 RepID=UPI0021E90989|nr:serine/threonine-protein kinase prp4-like [Andrographis paniculata]